MQRSLPDRKLESVNQILGAAIGTQDTVRTVFDTVISSGDRWEFFKNFSGKTITETNVNQNKLDRQESMVIQEILLCQESDGNIIFDGYCNFNLIIGNQRVIKDLALQFETEAGLQAYPIKHKVDKYLSIPMISQIVIPPDTEFSCSVEVFSTVDNTKIKCVLVGYGRLYNSNVAY